MKVVELTDVSVGAEGPEGLAGLAGVSLSVEAGEFVALVGPNRSGKSLLLKLCAGLVAPDRGTVQVLGYDMAGLNEEELVELRQRVGILLQPPGLLSNMTVYNNVALPLRYHRGLDEETLRPLVMAQLEEFGLGPLWNRFPAQLNEGEARCAAMARALILGQELLLLDDPAEGLDAPMVRHLGQLRAKYRETKPPAILATMRTYSPLMEEAERVAFLCDGKIQALGRHQDLLAMADERMQEYLQPVPLA
jgi:ABC-type transporter Mla maintaining outer membrane lipid asymmetry ATPase subunit MlaF